MLTQIQTDVLLLVPQFMALGAVVGYACGAFASLFKVFDTVATTGADR